MLHQRVQHFDALVHSGPYSALEERQGKGVLLFVQGFGLDNL